MPQTFCPRCQQNIVYNEYDNEIEHTCDSGQPVLDQEDYQAWNKGKDNSYNLAGVENQLEGTRAGIMGEHFSPVTERGNAQSASFQRQHYQFVPLVPKKTVG